MSANSGRAFVFGDDITTDALAPGAYMKKPVEEMASHCLEGVDPGFARAVRAGDVVVGGENFGIGSSREQAAIALRQLGVAVVVARSFGGLFFRNAVNLGLAPLVCAEAGRIRPGDQLAVEPMAGRIENLTTGDSYACEPIPAHLAEMIRDGGLLPHLEKTRRAKRG